MIENNKLSLISLTAAVIIACTITNQQVAAKNQNFFAQPGILARQILEARGYLAKDFNLVSEDGYRLRITRGRNPLINNGQGGLPGRAPILFVHGVLESSNVFIVNSFNVTPSDFSKINIKGVPLELVNAKFGDVPSAKSLPLLAMDFGHEVFLMSRRASIGSRANPGDPNEGVEGEAAGERVRGPLSNLWHGLTNYGHMAKEIRFSLDRKFWNFSIDEQARFDWPLAVNFVREHTKRDKIAVVGQSLGGAIALMALSMYPELNDKISAAIFWSESFSIGHGDYLTLVRALQPLLHLYVGPLPPTQIVGPLQRALVALCTTRLLQHTVCQAIDDSFVGFSAGQDPIRPEFINSLIITSSSKEIEQMVQSALLNGQMHEYARKKLKDAKQYDLSKITNTKMSFYMALTDTLASYSDNKATLAHLKVPHRTHPIKHAFNHLAYYFHVNNSRLAIIPSLQDIEELSELPPLPSTLTVNVASKMSVPQTNVRITTDVQQ